MILTDNFLRVPMRHSRCCFLNFRNPGSLGNLGNPRNLESPPNLGNRKNLESLGSLGSL